MQDRGYNLPRMHLLGNSVNNVLEPMLQELLEKRLNWRAGV
jgi:hypothetical protein